MELCSKCGWPNDSHMGLGQCSCDEEVGVFLDEDPKGPTGDNLKKILDHWYGSYLNYDELPGMTQPRRENAPTYNTATYQEIRDSWDRAYTDQLNARGLLGRGLSNQNAATRAYVDQTRRGYTWVAPVATPEDLHNMYVHRDILPVMCSVGDDIYCTEDGAYWRRLGTPYSMVPQIPQPRREAVPRWPNYAGVERNMDGPIEYVNYNDPMRFPLPTAASRERRFDLLNRVDRSPYWIAPVATLEDLRTMVIPEHNLPVQCRVGSIVYRTEDGAEWYQEDVPEIRWTSQHGLTSFREPARDRFPNLPPIDFSIPDGNI